MPELPEVEVVRAGLESGISGMAIAAASVLHPRPVRRHPGGPDDFATTLVGRTFAVPRRRGKYLWLPFADGDALLAHLGMSGQFRLDAPDAPLQRHARVVLDLQAGPGQAPGEPVAGGRVQLRFVDQRMFGGLSLSVGGAELPAEVVHIALDLFDPALDLDALVDRVRSSRSAVKRVLLDQRVVSGIGNIYADEALWRAGVHWATPATTLSDAEVRALLVAARDTMAEALAQGGTSFDALYVHVNGESGYFDRTLNAYGQAGRACARCGTPIVREAFANRGSFRCPTCQPTRIGLL